MRLDKVGSTWTIFGQMMLHLFCYKLACRDQMSRQAQRVRGQAQLHRWAFFIAWYIRELSNPPIMMRERQVLGGKRSAQNWLSQVRVPVTPELTPEYRNPL